MQFDLPESARIETLLVWLCSISSPTGEEQAIADALCEFLCRHGVVKEQFRRHGNSIYVELTRGRPGPNIALVGHTDVVRTQHDAPPRIDGDRIYGPGAADMKSGLALMLGLVTNPLETTANLTLIFYASEEGPYVNDELRLVIDAEPSVKKLDFALVLEPTDGQLQLGCGGTLHAEVTFEGKSAHSARPWQGQNAIYQAIGLLTRLATRSPVPRSVDGLEWMTCMSATLAHGGRAPNVIPDHFTLNVNARFAPDQTPAEVQAEIMELVAGEAKVEFVDCSPPAMPFRNHPFIALLEQAGGKSVVPKFGWTDVARFAQLGVPAANFGPGTLSQAHQSNEWTSLAELYRTNASLRNWLSSMPGARTALPPWSAAH